MKVTKKNFRFLTFLLFVCMSVSISAETIKGVPVHITSGDSFLMMIDWGKYINVKLYGVDAPDEGNTYFKDSQELLADYINGKKLEVYVKSKTGSTITGEVIAKDRGNVNLYILREGMAKNTAENISSYKNAEKSAKNNNKGIWYQY